VTMSLAIRHLHRFNGKPSRHAPANNAARRIDAALQFMGVGGMGKRSVKNSIPGPVAVASAGPFL
jgi:hypothetical protein